MKKIIHFGIIYCALAQAVFAQWPLTDAQEREVSELAKDTNIPPQMRERYMMVIYVNYKNPAYRMAVVQKMLKEANSFADKLQLPLKYPVQFSDIVDSYVSLPWQSIIHTSYPPHRVYFCNLPETIFTTNIYNIDIPREQRLRALKFGPQGYIETTNYDFGFDQGHIQHVMRLSEPHLEYYAHSLDRLVGQPSLIDTNGAYQLATQWLTAVGVDVPALEKQFPHSVNQLQYLARGATNTVLLPLYYVGLGTNVSPKLMPSGFDPAVEVEILGITKELQDLEINDFSFSHRPLLLITNALELIRTPNPPMKQLQRPTTNSPRKGQS